jgi:two-component system chemotaxis response regulator CheB
VNAAAPLHVLVVDDSAVVRSVATHILTRCGMEVTVAADPLIAMDKMAKRRPDVIVLDLEMPRMDGLTFLRRLMADDPLPVVVCSSLAGSGTATAFTALEEGAVAIVTKPKLGVRDFLEESAQSFADTVRGAAGARLRFPARLAGKDAVRPLPAAVPLGITTDKVIAIGASTGGTEAITEILTALPPDAPGIVVVQHMPEGFTAAFAERLNSLCRIEVKEAADGDRVRAGRALIARGNKHLTVVRNGAQYAARVSDGELVTRHRPSVDVLFRSVAAEAGANAVGCLLTGMGADGAEGLLAMRQAGAVTYAQDEATSVVFGMPKEAIELGAADHVVPLPRMAAMLLSPFQRH